MRQQQHILQIQRAVLTVNTFTFRQYTYRTFITILPRKRIDFVDSSFPHNNNTSSTVTNHNIFPNRIWLYHPTGRRWGYTKIRTVVAVSSSRAAREILGLPSDAHIAFTVTDLRNSFFRMAKLCHPDVMIQNEDENGDDEDDNNNPVNNNDLNQTKKKERRSATEGTADFVKLTQAYELLQQEAQDDESNFEFSSASEAAAYRSACQQQLGLSAEIVEECKQNPAFLQWLSGRTDSADYWRSFFASNGGLMPRSLQQSNELGNASSGFTSRRVRLRRR